MNVGSFDLIKELGYEDFSEENKKKILDNYSSALEARISTRIMQSLSEENQKKIDELVKEKKLKEADQYLVDNVEDLEFLIRDEVRKFKKEVIEQNDQLNKALEKFKKEELLKPKDKK